MSARRPAPASSTTSGPAAINALGPLPVPVDVLRAIAQAVEARDHCECDVADIYRPCAEAVRSHPVVVAAAALANTRDERAAIVEARSALTRRTCIAALDITNPIPF